MNKVKNTFNISKQKLLFAFNKVKAVLNQNKKLKTFALAFSALFGFLILVGIVSAIVIGIKVKTKKVVPNTPHQESTNKEEVNTQASPDFLNQTQDFLKSLDGQINNLDLEQKTLQPPTIYFNLTF